MLIFISLIFGLIIGSFLNVCIWRLPKNLSLIFPGSRCPHCEKPIAFYDNVPVLSFIILGGRCRSCRGRISWKYPLVEALTALMTAGIAQRWSGQWLWMSAALIAAYALIVIAFIDMEHLIIPDELSLGLAGFGLLASFINPYMESPLRWHAANSFLGCAVGLGVIWFLATTGELVFKKEAMGGGDIKLMAGIGALLGWQGVFSVLIIASFVGSVYGVLLIARKKAGRGDAIPFGPFLSLGAAINLLHFIPLKTFLWI